MNYKILYKVFAIFIVLLFNNDHAWSQTLAFPEAEGFGKYAEGGRGGEVIYVTNLDNDGPGSLRSACEAAGSRTVLFKTGGTIMLDSTIEITNPNITIAGQTAPGGGICLRMNSAITTGNIQATLAVITDHVIIRGMRFRAGPSSPQTTDQVFDCLDIWDGENIIIDHCSFTWGNDENIAIWSDIDNENPRKITIQKSIIGQGLQKMDTNGNISRGFGMLVGGSVGATDLSIFDNLFIHNAQRNPLLKTEQSSVFQMYNNIIYNYGLFGTDIADDVNVDLISNFYLEGNNTSTNRYEVLIKEQASLFTLGNIGLNRPINTLPEWDILGFNGIIPPDGYSESPAPLSFQSNESFSEIPSGIISANDAYNNLINSQDVGANFKLSENGTGIFVNNLDDADLTLITDLINNTGQTIFNTDIGNTIEYPILEAGTPPIDTDNDGMPDVWEQNCGLNSNDSSDRNEIASNNYTNLENYLNGIDCNSLSTNSFIDDVIKIYPNPFERKLFISKDTNEKIIASLTNPLGKIVMKKIVLTEKITIVDLSSLTSGLYILTINGNKKSLKLKILKN